jgi:phage gp29-like protein
VPSKLRTRSKLAQGITVPADNDGGWAGSGYVDVVERLIQPQTAESILRGAWGGDMSLQANLFISMMDTWARLADNMRTVENALTGAPFDVQPATDEEGNASDLAKEKAELVKEALKGMRPNAAKRELGRDGVLKALARGSVTGHAVLEILWQRREVGGQAAILPRCCVNVGPRWYGYPNNTGPLQFRNQLATWEDFPPNKFLVHVVPATDAHPSQAGRIRTLVKYWSYTTSAWQWLLQYTQRFGMPFRWATYRKESSQVRTALGQMMQNIGASGWGVFPEGTKLELHESGANAKDLPQSYVISEADKACDLVIRGETASSGADGSQGLGNTGAVYAGVRREAMQGYCNDAVVTLQSLAEMVIRLNYGETSEMPTVVCEIPSPQDAVALAQRDEILARMGLAIPDQFLRERHDVPAPTDGEATVSAPKPQTLTAAKAPADSKLEGVIERLLVAGILGGNAIWEEQLKEAEA